MTETRRSDRSRASDRSAMLELGSDCERPKVHSAIVTISFSVPEHLIFKLSFILEVSFPIHNPVSIFVLISPSGPEQY